MAPIVPLSVHENERPTSRSTAELPVSILGEIIGQFQPAVLMEDLARLIAASNLANNYEGSPLIDDMRIMMSVFFGNIHRHEWPQERAAGRTQCGTADSADDGADARQQGAGNSSGNRSRCGPRYCARRGSLGSILRELQARCTPHDANAPVGHIDAIRREAGFPQSGHRLLRLRLLLEDADDQIFSWFNHKATSFW